MEFNKKLQELRKQKCLTQEELANLLFVSRTAISKWESGRGCPNIESLKRIAELFSVTIDELLSNDELLTIAQEDNKQRENHFRNLCFGLFDVSALLLLFLPFFAQKTNKVISEVSLLSLTTVSMYLKMVYLVLTVLIILFGILTLAMQNCDDTAWISIKSRISLILNVIGVVVFTVSLQPYPSIFLLVFLIIKVLILIRK